MAVVKACFQESRIESDKIQGHSFCQQTSGEWALSAQPVFYWVTTSVFKTGPRGAECHSSHWLRQLGLSCLWLVWLCQPLPSLLLRDCLTICPPRPRPLHPHLPRQSGTEHRSHLSSPGLTHILSQLWVWHRDVCDSRSTHVRNRSQSSHQLSATPGWMSSLFQTNDCISPRTFSTSGATGPH